MGLFGAHSRLGRWQGGFVDHRGQNEGVAGGGKLQLAGADAGKGEIHQIQYVKSQLLLPGQDAAELPHDMDAIVCHLALDLAALASVEAI